MLSLISDVTMTVSVRKNCFSDYSNDSYFNSDHASGQDWLTDCVSDYTHNNDYDCYVYSDCDDESGFGR